MIDSSVNHKLVHVRTDDIGGTIFRRGQTNIKGSGGVPPVQAVLEQISDFRVAFRLCFKASPSAKPFI